MASSIDCLAHRAVSVLQQWLHGGRPLALHLSIINPQEDQKWLSKPAGGLKILLKRMRQRMVFAEDFIQRNLHHVRGLQRTYGRLQLSYAGLDLCLKATIQEKRD